MKSAIPPELQQDRTCPRHCAEDFAPPYPAFVGKDQASVDQAVMGYFGVQYRGEEARAAALGAFNTISALLGGSHGAVHCDRARCTDLAGYETLIAIAYWAGPAEFAAWQLREDVAGWWHAEERLSEGPGYFREIFMPSADRFETLFSSLDRSEGVAVAMGGIDPEDVQEHSYWGSMRDRIPAAQTDPLDGETATGGAGETAGRRVTVPGLANLAVIRSGQDWSDTSGREREMYLGEIEPTLGAGMAFLSGEGASVGCWSNRYMRHIGEGEDSEKSFGLSYWRSLADMEGWAESHPTHLAIFNGFLGMAGALNFQLDLRLYHEVSVLTPEQQILEYINCHPQTGLLALA